MLWYVVLVGVTLAFVAVLGRFETPARDVRPAPPTWRPVLGVVGVCAGLAALAVVGIVGPDGLRWPLVVTVLVSVYVGGVARAPGR